VATRPADPTWCGLPATPEQAKVVVRPHLNYQNNVNVFSMTKIPFLKLLLLFFFENYNQKARKKLRKRNEKPRGSF
jgi:hypothetical protein